MGGADVLVVSSRHEGFGVPVLEAMSIGLPVVANRAGALPEVVGDAGLLVDATDPYALAGAVARVLRGRGSSRHALAAAARRLAALDLSSAGDRAVDLVARALRSLNGRPSEPGRLGVGARFRAPTACCTSETKRRVEAARSKPAARCAPGRGQDPAQRVVAQHAPDGGGEGHRRLVVAAPARRRRPSRAPR